MRASFELSPHADAEGGDRDACGDHSRSCGVCDPRSSCGGLPGPRNRTGRLFDRNAMRAARRAARQSRGEPGHRAPLRPRAATRARARTARSVAPLASSIVAASSASLEASSVLPGRGEDIGKDEPRLAASQQVIGRVDQASVSRASARRLRVRHRALPARRPRVPRHIKVLEDRPPDATSRALSAMVEGARMIVVEQRDLASSTEMMGLLACDRRERAPARGPRQRLPPLYGDPGRGARPARRTATNGYRRRRHRPRRAIELERGRARSGDSSRSPASAFTTARSPSTRPCTARAVSLGARTRRRRQ